MFKNKSNKIIIFFLIIILTICFRQNCIAGKENLDPQLQHSSLKRKHQDEPNTEFFNCKRYKRSQDDQRQKLSIQSQYVKGDFCAQIRWVNDLNIYYGSKRPQKKVEVPATIHQDLAFIGNHLKACYVLSDTRPDAADKKNILIPFMSFVGKEVKGDRKFFKGNYLTMPTDQKALAFISGPTLFSMENKYHQYAANHNRNTPLHPLPAIKMIAGNVASELTKKDFDQINADYRQKERDIPYHFHSEEWFHEILGSYPQLAVNPIIKQLSPGDKVYALVFDMYSLWDVCNHCQQNFKKALFQRETIKKFEALLNNQRIRYPRNGLKVVFRVSSERPYFSDVRDQHIKNAGGGYSDKEGFDIKTVDSSQVTLSTRPYPTYNKVSSKVKDFFCESALSFP